jgi:aryl-alcohol dehydrogenase-like predicted oxidoreductase
MSNLPTPPTTRQMGSSGIEVSSLAWGMWRFAGQSVDTATALVHAALDAGITLFDTADIYGFGEQGFGAAEALLGEVFTANPDLRARMVLATKGGITPPVPYDSSAGYLTKAIDNSLARLRVEQVDLWQIHRPDVLTHPQEIARTIEDAVKAGKVRAFGVSNFTKDQIAALAQFSTVPIVTTQPEISPLRIDCIENGELDQAMAMDMAVLAWSPLGGGRIADPTNQREQPLPIAGSWRIRRGPSPSLARKIRRGLLRQPTPLKSNGRVLIGMQCLSLHAECRCHERRQFGNQLVLRTMRR